MLKQNHRLIAITQGILDIVFTVIALFSAYYIRFYSDRFTSYIPVERGIPPLSDFINFKFLVAIIIIWPIIFRLNRMYKTKRGIPVFDMILAVISSATLSVTIFLVFTFFFVRPVREGVVVSYSRALFLTFWFCDIVLILSYRLAIRAVSRYLRKKGFNQRHILIVGAGQLSQIFLQKIREHPEMGLQPVGFVDDDPEKQWKTVDEIAVLGTIDDAPEIIRHYGIEQVYITLPLSAHRRIYHLLGQIQNECVDIKLIPDILQYITLRAGFQNMDGLPVINLTETPLSGYNLILKRLTDVIISSIALIILSPLMGLIALLIRISSAGPVLYKQRRMGIDLKPFDIYKFRSMRENDHGKNGTGWTVENDPRITTLGKLLRRWNLDELPQFLNVLRGDMSLVGPRPEQPAFVEEFRERYPRYMLRHKVKSGITGWAQVNGYRGDTSIKKRLEYDMYYIENWSLNFDFKIMGMTALQTYRNFIRPQSPFLP